MGFHDPPIFSAASTPTALTKDSTGRGPIDHPKTFSCDSYIRSQKRNLRSFTWSFCRSTVCGHSRRRQVELVRVRRDLNRTTLEVRRLLANRSVSMALNWMALSKGCCNVGFSVVGCSKSMSSRSRQTMRGAALRGAAEERAVVLGAIEGKAKLSSSARKDAACACVSHRLLRWHSGKGLSLR